MNNTDIISQQLLVYPWVHPNCFADGVNSVLYKKVKSVHIGTPIWGNSYNRQNKKKLFLFYHFSCSLKSTTDFKDAFTTCQHGHAACRNAEIPDHQLEGRTESPQETEYQKSNRAGQVHWMRQQSLHWPASWPLVFIDIFNSSLSQGIVPECFKQSVIVPVLNKSEPSCLNDFYPVALTLVVMKCFFGMIRHFITSSLLDFLQLTYSHNRSTGDTISYMLPLTLSSLNPYS